MQVSKEELLHIAKLADLELDEKEIDNYLANLEDILNFANIVNNAPVDGLDITIGANSLIATVANKFLNSAGFLASALGNHECDNPNAFKSFANGKKFKEAA